MTCVVFIRHGPTAWNAAGRVQGHIDIGLSAEGRAKMAALRAPEKSLGAQIFVSPLKRTQETARLLGFEHFTIDARLAEQHCGRWEGLTREEIRAHYGENAFTHAGLAEDFHPPGGESTRALIARVQNFLEDAGRGERDILAISHLGVLRTAYALASGWDMQTPLPDGIDFCSALILSVAAGGMAGIVRLNVPLAKKSIARMHSGA